MKSKTKIMTIAAATLACVAVAGVGFASWVITNTVGANIQGSINVETVNDKSVVITATNPAQAINFTYKAGTYVNSWLTQEESTTAENLTATIVLNVSGYSNLNALTATLEPVLTNATYNTDDNEGTKEDGYKAAIDAGYITAPTIKLSTDENPGTIQLTQNSPVSIKTLVTANGEVTLTLTFGWGEKFGGVNPAEYYNAHKATDIISGTITYAQHAAEHLTALEDMLDGVAYKITFTPTANA